MVEFLIAILVSYLIGAIPTAYILGRFLKGIDIRQHGSGNVGATNAFRVIGKGPGVVALILDILKGLIVVTLIADAFDVSPLLQRLILALVVVCGHNWTIFLKFKGGKGIATSCGVLIGLAIKISSFAPVLLGTLLIWIVCFLMSQIVSLSSIIASICLPFLMVFTAQSFELVCLGLIFCAFVVFRHRPNIKRLLAGKEPRVPLSR